MKKKWQVPLILLFIVGFCSFPAFAVIEEYSQSSSQQITENAFMLRPLAIIASSKRGGFEIVSETPSIASTSQLGFNAIYTVGTPDLSGNVFFYGGNLGPFYNMTGKGLEGIYIGIYPGFL